MSESLSNIVVGTEFATTVTRVIDNGFVEQGNRQESIDEGGLDGKYGSGIQYSQSIVSGNRLKLFGK